VTITGTTFTGASAVNFGATPAAQFHVDSDTQITAVSPPGNAGPVDVSVTTPDGGTSPVSAADTFTYVRPPVVSSVTPSVGLTTGGTVVVVSGSRLSDVTRVLFGGTSATQVTVLSDQAVLVVVPAHPSGAVDVIAVAGGIPSDPTPQDRFTYLP
jgi:hypothetical protein